MKLDKTRDYGETWGASSHKYEQDGKFFNAQGDEVYVSERTIEPEPDFAQDVADTADGVLVVDKDLNGYASKAELRAALEKLGVRYLARDTRVQLMDRLAEATNE